jgi:hypothetical protein
MKLEPTFYFIIKSFSVEISKTDSESPLFKKKPRQVNPKLATSQTASSD